MRRLLLAAVLALIASGAQAATLNVVNGQLMGASDVLVDGSLYDVQFLDGTCIDLYNGCDELSDFTFQSQALAELAAQALLDQVFLDGPSGAFDSDPSLTNGCEIVPNFHECIVLTPSATLDLPWWLVIWQTHNSFTPNDGFDFGCAGYPPTCSADTTVNSGHGTYAHWLTAPIPEPTTASLLALGFLGLAIRRRG